MYTDEVKINNFWFFCRHLVFFSNSWFSQLLYPFSLDRHTHSLVIRAVGFVWILNRFEELKPISVQN